MIVGLGGEIRTVEEQTVHGLIEGVKCSFFRYPYRLLELPVPFRGLSLASIPDIASMKVVAIAQRGTKEGLFRCLSNPAAHSPKEVKGWFLAKYGEKRVNCYHILRSFFFFEDAEGAPEPVSRLGIGWAQVKSYFLANERTLFQSCFQNDARSDSRIRACWRPFWSGPGSLSADPHRVLGGIGLGGLVQLSPTSGSNPTTHRHPGHMDARDDRVDQGARLRAFGLGGFRAGALAPRAWPISAAGNWSRSATFRSTCPKRPAAERFPPGLVPDPAPDPSLSL